MTVSLTPELLVRAYSMGIFPMGGDDGEIRWYSPDPRGIIDLDDFHAPRRLLRTCRQGVFELRVDSAWSDVIAACARRDNTWISGEIIAAYTQLHQLGIAHSVEAYREGRLAGGLYGVALGGAFFGESMFHRVTDASKVALVYLVERLRERGYTLLDSQYLTDHLSTFGGRQISRDEYLIRLAASLRLNCRFV